MSSHPTSVASAAHVPKEAHHVQPHLPRHRDRRHLARRHRRRHPATASSAPPQTLRHLDWFEVTQVRGQVKDGAVEHFQVGLKVGFRLEDD